MAKKNTSGQGDSAFLEVIRKNASRIIIIVAAVAAIVIGVVVWNKVDPNSMPIWLQQIIMDVRKFFGDHEYTLYYGSWT